MTVECFFSRGTHSYNSLHASSSPEIVNYSNRNFMRLSDNSYGSIETWTPFSHLTCFRRQNRGPYSQKGLQRNIRGQISTWQRLPDHTTEYIEPLSRVGSIFCLHSVLMDPFNSHLLLLSHSPIRIPKEHMVEGWFLSFLVAVRGIHLTVRKVLAGSSWVVCNVVG